MSAPLRHLPSQEPATVEERIRSLVEEGRILEARDLLKEAGDQVPAESNLGRILGPPRVSKSDLLDVDRSPEFLWLKKHAHEYQGKWVALVEENLVASSTTLKELLARLDQLQFEQEPLLHHLI
jgi:Family of unknown function (DUF5678)